MQNGVLDSVGQCTKEVQTESDLIAALERQLQQDNDGLDLPLSSRSKLPLVHHVTHQGQCRRYGHAFLCGLPISRHCGHRSETRDCLVVPPLFKFNESYLDSSCIADLCCNAVNQSMMYS